jgi:hypothetical protein
MIIKLVRLLTDLTVHKKPINMGRFRIPFLKSLSNKMLQVDKYLLLSIKKILTKICGYYACNTKKL